MARAHLRARHSLLRPSAPRCLSRRSWRHGNLYASSQSPAASKSHRSRERENKKRRKQFPPRGRGCHGAIKRLGGVGGGGAGRVSEDIGKRLERERKNTIIYLFLSGNIRNVWHQRAAKYCGSRCCCCFPPSSYTGALRHSLECRVEEVEVVAVRWWEIRTFNASFSRRSLVSSSQSRP